MQPIAQEIDLPSLEGAAGKPLAEIPLGFLETLKVKVSVRLGEAEAAVGDLLAMKSGEVLTLDRELEQPVDVLVNGHVVARGTLVAVGDHFGVRLTEPPTLRSGETNKP